MEPAFVIQKSLECSRCGEYVTYYCKTCESNLCGECKRKHFNNTDTGNHSVVIYRGKFKKCIEELCEEHPKEKYIQVCKVCEVPVCKTCKRKNCHKNHKFQDLQVEKQNKDLETSTTELQNTILPQYRGVQDEIIREKVDFKEKADKIMGIMESNAHILENYIRKTLEENRCRLNRELQKFSKEEKRVDHHITELQSLLDSYEESTSKPAEFLLLSKKRPLPDCMRKFIIPKVPSFVAEVNITKDDVEKLLGKLTVEKKEIKPSYEHLYRLKLKATKEITVSVSVENIRHISCVGIKNWVWVSGSEYLVLVDKTGDKLNEYEINSGFGCHSVASDCRLYYLSKNGNICTDRKKDVIKASQRWKICSIYCSCKNSAIIVGMKRGSEAKLMKYDNSGNPTAIVLYDSKRNQLFISPDYITENCNDDIVVSDSGKLAVVVTDYGGNHRFSFTGCSSSMSKFNPRGICTDILSNILVCDIKTETIQILNKDGTFIQYLQTDDQDFRCPYSLCYDLENQLLWIGGLDSNMLIAYRYLERQL
ncbi:uncharacterized protein LOC133196804 [Saccostrea echinata]|uniref:uncharacterized protein LOC133196804 n=1 Tax=Saccostrea echinata TaxID=191078 RepID=UPI002A7EB409|nr:uncharacterized protein LOC133196804 [Saccostrea echinata]